MFGIYAVITYPLYYSVWIYTHEQGYENIILHAIVVALCIPLIFVKNGLQSGTDSYLFIGTSHYGIAYLFIHISFVRK